MDSGKILEPTKSRTKPILRLESLEDFKFIPDELKTAIQNVLGVTWDINNFDVRVIAEDEYYANHYTRRIQAVNAGAQFLLDSLLLSSTESTENKRLLKTTLDNIALHCITHLNRLDENGVHDIAFYQNTLVNYCNVIAESIQHSEFGAGFKNTKAIKKQIDRSEQFATASQPRPTVCTVTSFFGEPLDRIALIDQPLNPFDEQLVGELQDIKDESMLAIISDETRRLPTWFNALTLQDKRLLKHFLDQINPHEDLGTRVNALSSKMRIIPAPANYARHTLISILTPADNAGDPQLVIHPVQIRSSHIATRDISRDNAEIRDRHASYNLAKEVLDAIAEEKKRRPASNQTEAVVPILFQTLITPFRGIQPDCTLDANKAAAINTMTNYLSNLKPQAGEPNLSFFFAPTNHPLNYGKYFMPTTALSETAQTVATLLFVLENQPDTASHPLFMDAAEKLKRYTSSWKRQFTPYRELYLSSLEQIIISLNGGISIGSCVSGKDRKAVEIAHTDAMKVYLVKYNAIPPLVVHGHDKNEEQAMQRFAEIFAEIYCTKHQMAIADLNAPGSFGIKTPNMYLPEHLIAAINQWYQLQKGVNEVYIHAADKSKANAAALFDESDVMASNNDVWHFKYITIPGHFLDLAWNKKYLYFSKSNAMEILISETVKALTASPGWWATLMGDHSHHAKITLYKGILQSTNLTTLKRAILLYALITSPDVQPIVCQIMKVRDVTVAQQLLVEYLKQTLLEQEDIHKFPEMLVTVDRLQQTIAALKNNEQIPDCITEISHELNVLLPTSPKLTVKSPH